MSKFKYKPGMKKHQVLKEAMKYIDVKNLPYKKNKYEFICHCINKVINDNKYDFTDYSGLIAVIDERIYPDTTFSDWLNTKHEISYEDMDANGGRKLQYTRLCWMQSMYEEFLAKDE